MSFRLNTNLKLPVLKIKKLLSKQNSANLPGTKLTNFKSN